MKKLLTIRRPLASLATIGLLSAISIAAAAETPAASATPKAVAPAGTPKSAAPAPAPKTPAASSATATATSTASATPAAAPTSGDTAAATPTEEQVATAKEAYSAGTAAFEAGDFVTAEAQFRKAYDTLPSPHAEYWIAVSKDRQNKPAEEVVSAYDTFLAGPAAGRVGEEKVHGAKARADELRATLPATVLIESTPAGASIIVNGVAVDGKTPTEVKLAPGTHRVELQLSGYEPSVVELQTEGGTRVRAPIALKELPPAAPVAATATPAAQEKKERDMTPAYVTLGIGAAGLISGTVFGILALNAKSEYDSNPTQEKRDEVERNALIADMSFGVAITLGLTGVVLLTASDEDLTTTARASAPRIRKAPQPQAGQLVVAPWGGPTGGGANARLTF